MRFLLASFLAKEEIVGVDIGDTYVAAAQLAIAADGTPRLIDAGGVPCAPGASEKETAAALKQLWRHHGFSSRMVCSCLRTPSLILRPFELAHLSDTELQAALRLEAEEALQTFGKDVAADWLLLRQEGAAAAGTARVHTGLLCAAPRRDVDRHLRVLVRAGLYPVVVDVGCLAVCNLFLSQHPEQSHEENAVCLVSLLHHSADIAILCGGDSVYPRSVLCTSSVWEESPDYFAENLEDALRYYRLKRHLRTVGRIVLTGNLPAGDAFYDTVRKRLNLPVERWDPLERVAGQAAKPRRGTNGETFAGPLLATSLGLALRRS